MLQKIIKWWEGESKMDPPESGPGYVMVPPPYTEYHWRAKVARAIVTFYLRHWQWLWMAAIAIGGVYVTYLQLGK